MRLRMIGKGTNLRGKRVLVRMDGNVPVLKGKAVDGAYGKIARSAVGIDWLRQRGAKVIVMTHRGRPEGKRVPAYSVKPIARRLSELLGVPVAVSREITGPRVEKRVRLMQEGDVLMLENIRFDPREENNSPAFARQLAALGDLFVNDAFAVSHRAHASTDAITSELPSYAGPLLYQEVSGLSKAVKHPRHPLILAMGGLKMEAKIPVMEHLLPLVDQIMVGGALATAFLRAKGHEVGRSVYDEKGVRAAKKILAKSRGKILLPVDVTVVRSLASRVPPRQVFIGEVDVKDMIVDIGPESMKAYVDALQGSKTIVWNGPFGYTEREPFRAATKTLAHAVAERADAAMTVIGGGDTVPLIEELGLADRFTLLSTGGGAMLDFLAGKELPGLKALET